LAVPEVDLLVVRILLFLADGYAVVTFRDSLDELDGSSRDLSIGRSNPLLHRCPWGLRGGVEANERKGTGADSREGTKEGRDGYEGHLQRGREGRWWVGVRGKGARRLVGPRRGRKLGEFLIS